MQSTNLKIIAVADGKKVILYEAQGLKISKMLATFSLEGDGHHVKEKAQGRFQKASMPAGMYQLHTSTKELEHQDAARLLSSHLEEVCLTNEDYKSLIIVAEPKMLGYIRQYLSDPLKKILIKEVGKDLIHQDKSAVEHAVFSG